jgi:hypothetical protein
VCGIVLCVERVSGSNKCFFFFVGTGFNLDFYGRLFTVYKKNMKILDCEVFGWLE